MVADESQDDRTRSFVVLTVGTEISHYRIINKIGAGGMGEVYLAEDTELDRKVALKFLSPHLCADEDCRKRFKREAQAAAKLDHPNIIPVYEVGDYQGRPYFAMAHVEGQSLKEYLSGTELNLDQVVELGIQICDGLQAAHEQDVTHRDIKPSNILIDSHGRARIVDFGLAAVKGTDQLTKAGSTMGTIGYMSPEQVRGQQVDHRSDLFSLGVILYEMTAGRLPFKADTEAGTMNAVLNITPEPLSRYKTGVSGEFQHVICKLLEKDTKLRYQTAAGVISDLKRLIVAGEAPVKQPWSKRPLVRFLIGCIIGLALFAAGDYFFFGEKEKAPERQMIAVLPFENLGDPEDEYFADGITEEIISRLAGLHDIGVISRTSSLQYKGTSKNLRQIGDELEVQYVLEGTIRWDKSGGESRVRINPQLIRVEDDVHLWADRYDAVIDDIFSVQSIISERVVEALDITLLDSERQVLVLSPTDNTEAYDFCLRGLEYLYRSPSESNLRSAEAMFNQAIAMEPDYALAHIWLSFAHGQMILFEYDRSSDRLAAAKAAVDRALEISPGLPEAHGALGWYYYQCLGDLDRALVEFSALRDKRPSEAQAYMGIAAINRRRGQWNEAAENWKRATELDPLAARVCWEYGFTLLWLRRYAEAEKLFTRANRVEADFPDAYLSKARLYVLWKGDLDSARAVLQQALEENGQWPDLTVAQVSLDIMAREYRQALDRLAPSDAITAFVDDSATYYNLKGDLYRYLKQAAPMRACYDSARAILERAVREQPDDAYCQAYLGRTYAGLGRKDDAISRGERAVELQPISQSSLPGTELATILADIYAIVGEHERAVDQLDLLLSIPSEVSLPSIDLWPEFDSLRDHPRFKALIEKYENEHGI